MTHHIPRERRNWTPEEDAQLERAVTRARTTFSSLPWHTVAASVPGRTNKDCRKRWHYKLDANVNKGVWSINEDEKLKYAVGVFGLKWSRVAGVVGTRNGDQCSKRWKNTLDPGIERGPWSEEEDNLLLECVERTGHKWTAIVEENFPGRTALSAKNQYAQLCRSNGNLTPGSEHVCSRNSRSSSQSQSRGRGGGYAPLPLTPQSSLPEEDNKEESAEEESSEEEECENEGRDNIYFHPGLEGVNGDATNHPQESFNTDQIPMPDFSSGHFSSFNDQPQPLPYADLDFTYQNPELYATTAANNSYFFSTTPSSQFDYFTPAISPDSGYASNPISPPPAFQPNSGSMLDPPLAFMPSPESTKQLTVSTFCTRQELQNLMRMTVESLGSVRLSVNTQRPAQSSRSGNSKRQVTITATCAVSELGGFMQLVSETMKKVKFAVGSVD